MRSSPYLCYNMKWVRMKYLQFCKWRSIKKFVTPLHFMYYTFYNNSRRNFEIREKNRLATIGTDDYATWFLCQIGIFLCYMFAINQCCIITILCQGNYSSIGRTSFLEKQGLWIFSYVFIHPNPLMFFTWGQCKCKLFVRVILTQFFFPFLVNHLSKLMPRRVTKCPSLQNFFLLGKKNRKEKLKRLRIL